MKPVRVALFASGNGSNAMSLIHRSKSFSSSILEISFVLSDQPSAPVLEKAKAAGVPTYLLQKKAGRAEHEQEILQCLREQRIDWIFLAGYMRLLSVTFLETFASWHEGASQVVNIHPSLLPAFPGTDSIARAYNEKVPVSGVSLHLVDEGMDTGRILIQEPLSLSAEESLETWTRRMHELEHRIYGNFLESLVSSERQTRYFQEKR